MLARLCLGVALGAGAFLAAAVAQEVTVLDPAWLDPHNVAGEQAPAFKRPPRITYPRELRDSDELGYVLVVQSVDAKGKRLVLGRGGSHPYFERAVFDAMSGSMDQRPAVRAGAAVESVSWYAFIFHPRAAREQGPDAQPRLLAVAPVVVPKQALGELNPSRLPAVWGVVTIDPAGKPQGLTLPEVGEPFRPAIEASLAHWTFAPARRGGTSVAAEVRVPFVLQPPMRPEVVATMSPPRVTKQVRPVYPLPMRRSGMRGEVVVSFEVGVDGKVRNAVVQRSNHPSFDEPALVAVRQWQFEPAQRGGTAVATTLSVPVLFQIEGEPGGGAEAVRLTGGRDQSKLPEELRYDTPPKPRAQREPVYPYPLLRTGAKGKATVTVLVGPHGKVIDWRVLEASAPEFGLAVGAMAELLEFEPALKNGQPTSAMLMVQRNFSVSAADAPVSNQDRALLRLEEKTPEKIVTAKGLDQPLQPISRRAPVFPAARPSTETTGEAVIEFLVDDDGRARLPRVISASEPEFGYAAVQAVAAWEFERPLAGGKPAVVRARIPFKFTRRGDEAP
jgi:TonB family protein